MANRKVTFSHPDLSIMGTMTGHIAVDEWEGEEFFYPDPQYHQKLVSKYGVEPAAGIFLAGAKITDI